MQLAQVTAGGEVQGPGTLGESGPVARFWELLEEIDAAHDLALMPGVHLVDLVAESASRGELFEHGPGEFAGEGWLEQLERLESHHDQTVKLINAVRLLVTPTAKRLRVVLEGECEPKEAVEEALRFFDQRMRARQPSLAAAEPADMPAVLQDLAPAELPKAVAAVLYRSGRMGVTAISRGLGLGRAKVYRAAKWFEGLPEQMREEIDRFVSKKFLS